MISYLILEKEVLQSMTMADLPKNPSQEFRAQENKTSEFIHKNYTNNNYLQTNSVSNVSFHSRPSQASSRPIAPFDASKGKVQRKTPNTPKWTKNPNYNVDISSNRKPMKSHLIQQVSERPFVIKIRKYSTIPKSKGLPVFDRDRKDETTTRSGRRVQNLKKSHYDFDTDDSDEMEFDDSAVEMHPSNAAPGLLPIKKGYINSKEKTFYTFKTPVQYSSNDQSSPKTKQFQINTESPGLTGSSFSNKSTQQPNTSHLSQPRTSLQNTANSFPSNIEAPPQGILPSLWYSRECFLHIFVIEKILSWKKRHKIAKININPQSSISGMNADYDSFNDKNIKNVANNEDYAKKSESILNHLSSIRKPHKRMDVSRINPFQCPTVLTAVTPSDVSFNAKEKDRYQILDETEDLLLIKWRGHSYIHCSWERPSDLIRFDPTNNTAKQKIKRFYALQETTLGSNWKMVLEEGRKIGTTSNSKDGEKNNVNPQNNENDEEEEDELAFPPEFMEAERILACDESSMDLNIFKKQLISNQEMETKLLKEREKKSIKNTNGEEQLAPRTEKNIVLTHEKPWDPEDNVRYVVKWKGMQTSEVTWEYWKDIKYDFVHEVVEFWDRERAPSMETVKIALVKPHPLVKDFKKVQKSPIFGVKRKIIPMPETDDDEDQQNALRLRAYQLEGVNWLLWNWFNKRSCILADEMGLGKTIQSVALLDQLSKLEATKVRGPFLIVAPLSLISQWQSECKTWAPDLNAIVYHGSADARDFMVKHEFYYNDQFVGKGIHTKLKKMNWTKFHVLITTFEVVLKDIAVLSKIK